MKKVIIEPKILKRWLQAKIELHSDKLTAKEERQIQEFQRMNPCKYCTHFLTEQPVETEDNYECIRCGLREQEETD